MVNHYSGQMIGCFIIYIIMKDGIIIEIIECQK